MSHEGHVVNESSIFTHARTESDLTVDEKNQLATFGKMGSTGLNAHNGLFRLFTNRAYNMNISTECNNVNVDKSFKQDLLEGKYDQM